MQVQNTQNTPNFGALQLKNVGAVESRYLDKLLSKKNQLLLPGQAEGEYFIRSHKNEKETIKAITQLKQNINNTRIRIKTVQDKFLNENLKPLNLLFSCHISK